MKVLGINGSPHIHGNSDKALRIFAEILRSESINMEFVQIGNKVVRGCMACNMCFENKDRRCIFEDAVNENIDKLAKADAIVLATPVHYSGINGTMKSFLDKVAYISAANGGLLNGKFGAAIAICRRTGGSATLAGLQSYFQISGMHAVGSTYWTVAHGHGDMGIEGDEEGQITIKNQALNMAYLLKCKEKANLPEPKYFEVKATNFVR